MGTNQWLMTAVLMVAVVLLNCQTLEAQEADVKCNLNQYIFGMSSCWTPYMVRVFGEALGSVGGANEVELPGGMDPNVLMIAKTIRAFMTSCGEPLDGAIKCHAAVDKTCRYGLVDTDLLKNTLKSLCTNLPQLGNIGQCVVNTTTDLIGCLAVHSYTGDICQMTKSLRKCLTNFLSACPTFANMIGMAFDTISLKKCVEPSIQDSGKCTGTASLMTVGQCYIGPVITIVVSGIALGPEGAKTMFGNMCKLGNMASAVECHAAVQSECDIQYINTDELMKFKDNMCTNFRSVESIGLCVDGVVGLATLNCLNLVELKEENVLCDATEKYNVCLNNTFMGDFCGDKSEAIRSTMETVFQTVSLPCPETESNPECSLIEHGATLGMCWYPTIKTLLWKAIAEFQYNPVPDFEKLCGLNRHVLDKTLACHIKSDKKCDYGVLSEQTLKGMTIDTFCKNISAFFEMSSCISGPAPDDLLACGTSVNNKFSTNEEFLCEVAKHTKLCLNSIITRCATDVQELLEKMMQYSVDEVCSLTTATTGTSTSTPTTLTPTTLTPTTHRTTTFTTTKPITTTTTSTTTSNVMRTEKTTSGSSINYASLALLALILAFNVNLNGFLNDWITMIGRLDSLL